MSEAPVQADAGPATTRWRWRWVLVGSLALNLLVIGALAGAYFAGPRHGHPRWSDTPAGYGLMHFSRKLPPERRDAVRGYLREGRASMKELRQSAKAVRLRAIEELASPSYDRNRMKTIMEAIAAAESRMRDTGVEALLQAVDVLSPEERRDLAKAWRKRMGGRGKSESQLP